MDDGRKRVRATHQQNRADSTHVDGIGIYYDNYLREKDREREIERDWIYNVIVGYYNKIKIIRFVNRTGTIYRPHLIIAFGRVCR